MGLRGGTPGSKWQAERAREELTDRYESESIRRALEQPNPKEWRERQRRQDMSELTIEQVKELQADLRQADALGDTEAYGHNRGGADVEGLLDFALSLHAQLLLEQESRDRMEEALLWYADASVYRDEIDGEPVVMVDGGSLAQQALTRPNFGEA